MGIKLNITWHMHQPTYQLDKWFDKAMSECYWQLLEAHERHPFVKGTFHISGSLLQKMKERYPDFLSRMKTLVNKGQIELLTSSFHQSILPLWHEEDGIAQIKKHKEFVKEVFGIEPIGAWIPERVWKPELVRMLNKCDLKFILLDEHLLKRGSPHLWDVDIFYPKVHNFKGEKICVFNINKTMRYLVPFKSIDETISYLRYVSSINQTGKMIVVCADDAEKVGHWNNKDYAGEWIEKFYSEIERNNWIETVHLSEYLNENEINEAFYAEGTYEEMESWSGGNFRNHLNHPLSKGIYDRVLLAREFLFRKRKHPDFKECYENLLVSQCNDVFWGMRTITYLRQMAYHHALKADKIAHFDRELLEEKDIDKDGVNEILLKAGNNLIIISPKDGARIVEWDNYDVYFNLVNCDLIDHCHKRNSFSLYFPNLWKINPFPGEPATAPYSYKILKNSKKRSKIEFKYTTATPGMEGIEIVKRIEVKRNSPIYIREIEITNKCEFIREVEPAVEFFFSLPTFSSETCYMPFHKYVFEYGGRRVEIPLQNGVDGPEMNFCCVRDEHHDLTCGVYWEGDISQHWRNLISHGETITPVFLGYELEEDAGIFMKLKFGALKGDINKFKKIID